MPRTSNFPSPSQRNGSDVRAFLTECGLPQYYDKLMNEGFDRLSTIMDVTEKDLAEMNMKRGHRRVLQRHIATRKGIPSNQPLYQLYRQHEEFGENYLDITSPPTLAPFSPNGPGFYPEMAHALASSTEEEDEMGSRSSQNNEETLSNSGKRQYRRHPKADLNAPIKPASGYVMFANVLREEIKEQNLSFADIAKVVGERWKQIGADEKFYWEDAAAKAKHEYLKQVAEYKKTANYEMYQKYLRQFEQQGSDRVLGRPRRRRGMRGQRRDSPSMAATGASSGNESISMQREPSLTAVDSPRPTREPLVRSNSGDSVSQVYKPLSVVYRQSSIRNQDKRPENARSASHQSSGSTESSNSSESAAVPSLEQEALRFSKHEHSH